LVEVDLSVACVQFSVDPPSDSVDRSDRQVPVEKEDIDFRLLGRT